MLISSFSPAVLAFNNERALLSAIEAVKIIDEAAENTREFQNVIREYRKILFRFQGHTFAPTLAVLHSRVADILFETGDSQQGLRELLKIAELYPSTPQGHDALNRINTAFDSLKDKNESEEIGLFSDLNIGFSFYYVAKWWQKNDDAAQGEVKLFLERRKGAPFPDRKFSVMTSKTADITSPDKFSEAIFNEMKKLPDVHSLRTLSFKEYSFGRNKLFLRKSKAQTVNGTEILFQATSAVNEHIIVLTMADNFVNLNDAGKEFFAIMGTLVKLSDK